MKEIVVKQTDANSESAVIREWHVADRATVKRNQILVSVETSKAIYDLESPADGILIHRHPVGAEVPILTVIGAIAEEGESADKLSKAPATKDSKGAEPQATIKAKEFAEQHGIDLSQIKKEGVITTDDLQSLVNAKPAHFLPSDQYPPGVRRVLVFGAANGLAQVADILAHYPEFRIVGCVDDNDAGPARPFDVPKVGKIKDAAKLYREKQFDCAVVAISSNITVRKRVFIEARELGIEMINVIDRSVNINRFVSMGQGNVICGLARVGTYTSIGDNNFISAYCNIEHHNIWGSHNTLGPGCVFSGRVKVGDETKFATGIFVQNGIEIGSQSVIASGAILTSSVPDAHIVKTQIRQIVSPRKESGKS